MKKIKTKFKGLFVVNTKVFKDKRGWLKEEFKKKFIKKNLVFTLVSSSKKNALRGLHMQTVNSYLFQKVLHMEFQDQIKKISFIIPAQIIEIKKAKYQLSGMMLI